MGNVFGWAGKLLFVDLSTGRVDVRETAPYAADYVGGRGFASRIAWDELPKGIGALDPENMLMVTVGPLTGTSAPYSGRTTISGLSAQGWPHEWFSRSGLGGHFGATLKYAGYDGIFIKGKASEPVYLWCDNNKVEIRSARALWGKGIYDTQKLLMEQHGKDIRVLTIGQAGENLSRIAIIATETESAAGQGGYGAVMGSKNLKAIAVRGSGAIYVAEPDKFWRICQAIGLESHASHGWPAKPSLEKDKVEKYGQRWQACTQGCRQLCIGSRFYTGVPGPATGRLCGGQFHCASGLFQGFEGTFYNWKMGFEAGFEASTYANDWGLNHWDLLFGIMPWLRACRDEGLAQDIDGMSIDLDNPHFWYEIMRKITFREGAGEALAEGGRRAPALLGFGEEQMAPLYPAWGYAGHWDSRGDHGNVVCYPFWLVTALQWAVDVRDPLSSGHGYVQNVMNWSPFCSPEHGISWEKIKTAGAQVWGSPLAADPESGYAYKAEPAVYDGHRSMLKDSLTVDDDMFPRIYSNKTEDGFARAGDMDGPDFEWHMFRAATGLDLSRDDLLRCGERGFNLERSLQVRLFGRTRADDEGVISYFETEENDINAFIGHKMRIDREQFLKLMDQYYALRGWDVQTGCPTRAKLVELGLGFVADELHPSA